MTRATRRAPTLRTDHLRLQPAFPADAPLADSPPSSSESAVAKKTETEAPDATPEHEAQREEHTGYLVGPVAFKGRRVSVDVDDRETVEHRNDARVLGVGEFFNDGFQAPTDFFNVVVGVVTEEHVDIAGRRLQSGNACIFAAIVAQGIKLLAHTGVVGVVDDHFLAV